MTKFFKTTVIMAALVAAVSLCGCRKDDDPVALTVNGTPITQSEIDDAVDILRIMTAASPEAIMDTSVTEHRKKAARNLAINILLANDIKERGWTADSARVEEMVERFIAQFPSREMFMQQLLMMGESEESMRRGMAQEILFDSVVTLVSQGVGETTEEEARAYYEANKERFAAAGRMRASHIVFTVDSSADAARIEERAKQALAEAKTGADFDELIKKYSTNPEKGDLGWFRRGYFMPDIERVLIELPKGGVSELVRAGPMIYIFKKTDVEESYTSANAMIKEMLTASKKTDKMNDYIGELLSKADIKFKDKSIQFELKLPDNEM